MDRKGQLANVAFGGAWSEQIAGNEAMAAAMAMVETAAGRTAEEDLRNDNELAAALKTLVPAHPKGCLLATAWDRALGLGNPGLRGAELARIAAALRAGLGRRLDHP